MARYYVDTCIWRDYFEDRHDALRPLGEFAFQFILSAGQRNDIILFSDATVRELKTKFDENQINSIFEIVANKKLFMKVTILDEQIKEAKSICGKKKMPFTDVLHALLARDNDAVLVIRDVHFTELTDICPVAKPEELI